MWSIALVVAAFAPALVVMSFSFMGGAVGVAVPGTLSWRSRAPRSPTSSAAERHS